MIARDFLRLCSVILNNKEKRGIHAKRPGYNDKKCYYGNT
jgi:hypothetical protein